MSPKEYTQSSFFLRRRIKPTKAGKSILIIKRKIDALKATEGSSPNFVRKNSEAPSRIPNSPNEIGGITVLTNIIKLPAHR